jgi:FtsH-binding integral membrane protein
VARNPPYSKAKFEDPLMDTVKTLKIIDGMSFWFLGLIIVSVGINVISQWNTWGISSRAFIWVWLLGFLLASTLVLKNNIKEHTEEKQKYILEWGAAVIIGMTIGFFLLSFVQ